ncbi:hypothetical protein C2857_000133 [Epichloe festucae Fl1]|uniref:DUF7079 domain-containing protein n=1 Tax=Epichloe festucae (strain Fl1) TaxID=877507 RepID=A0A7S9KTW1_EPIFF|nr:hypothetical protein C2857_000133 [Epichloe festucae Fl1]
MSNNASLSEAEKDACICLSTLFLDCEMTPAKMAMMAQSLHRLHIPVDELDNILRHDVFPILYPNLLSPAGVWDSFDEADLITRVNGRRTHRPNVLQALSSNIAWMVVGRSVNSVWARVKEMLVQLDREASSKRSSSL